ncbi:hypothetical protein BVG16_09605 [Paenibacillus selenitireducens]|uniref:Glyoxalase/fosfomycin resistance/dioxygenase domain-containing protein n=1 Tax=Paenibacillus selenitireducens TaxID=1324314 RepID=A0A1T2XI13_9BACL|nr:VOC family protein [Paenibacillus selenitireducens]OPA79510.1 hypothetical protein BVG16_09605 [Paenibacillus selenitireducens]
MTSASPFLVVDNVEESIKYYQSRFGGETKILNEHQGVVMHAELHLGQTLLHFSGTFGGRIPKATNVKVILLLEKREELQQVYEALIADQGQVTTEIQDTFFGALHAEVTDSMNHINWVMNCFNK